MLGSWQRKVRRAVLLVIGSCVLASAQAPAGHGQWEPEIQAFEAADRQAPPPKGGVVFVGSSSIRMWTTLAADFPRTKIVNRGFGGSEIADSTYFADRIVIPYAPRLVVFYAGDNDLNNGKSPEDVLAAFEAFVARVRKDLPRTKIAFISVKPSPSRAQLLESMRAANRLVRDFTKRGRRLEFIDVFTPMLDSSGQPRPELFGEDRLHMNRSGYELWKSIVGPYLR